MDTAVGANQEEPQGKSSFPFPWSLSQMTNGNVVLSIVVNGAIAPVLAFANPEIFHIFIKDMQKGMDEFYPASVVEAIEVLQGYKDGDEEKKEEPPPAKEYGVPSWS